MGYITKKKICTEDSSDYVQYCNNFILILFSGGSINKYLCGLYSIICINIPI